MEKHECFNCRNTSNEAPLIKVEVKGVEQWVCVRCLPMLIHGS